MNSKPESSPKMSEYRKKQASSSTAGTSVSSPVAFRGGTPAIPCNPTTVEESSIFPGFSKNLTIGSKMDELFGNAISPSEDTVEQELDSYASGSSQRDTDILHFWEVSLPCVIRIECSQSSWYMQINKGNFPTLFAIAMDYLPVQASSAPCQRVFLSAEETDTKRNQVHPILMEILQTMKYSLKKDHRSTGGSTGGSKLKTAAQMADSDSEDLLAQLVTGDRQAATDALLAVFETDVKQVELGGDS